MRTFLIPCLVTVFAALGACAADPKPATAGADNDARCIAGDAATGSNLPRRARCAATTAEEREQAQQRAQDMRDAQQRSNTPRAGTP